MPSDKSVVDLVPIQVSAVVLKSAVASLVPIKLVIVVLKFGSSFSAAASSLRVSRVVGAVSIKLDTALSTYVSVANPLVDRYVETLASV